MTESIEAINEEIYSRIPYKDDVQHLYASSINLILSGNYIEGYNKYKIYLEGKKQVDQEERYKIATFVVSGLLKEQAYHEAKNILLEIKDEYIGDPFIYNNLAVVLVKEKEIILAVQVLKKAIAIHPEHEELKRNYYKLKHYLNS